jgi:hypothetical protein
MQRPTYNPKYDGSWALVVGINAYKYVSPLGYACNDAEVFADQLTQRFGFPRDNIKLLLDKDASLKKIRGAMAELARDTGEDDRVVVFYAGHGHTVPAHRREAGFLVPVDGKCDDTSSLVPWDDLVSTSRIIRAKHVLFIMDACYGGLMGMRALSPGTARFARDMLSRYSRQVLTAGKADEVVADCGGPRNGHSMFTGHLLDALDGAITTNDGLVTANAVMAYVYDRVAKDPHSDQSPHYGFLDGDGDLFFTVPQVEPDPAKEKDVGDVLIEVPADLEAPPEVTEPPAIIDKVKQYLSEPRYRIQLNDIVMRQLRAAQTRTGEDHFPLGTKTPTAEEFAARLKNYEDALKDIMGIAVLLGKWATDDQHQLLRQIVQVLAGQIENKGGLVLWLSLRWYPMLLSMYAGGIAAIESDNYTSLKTLFATQIRNGRRGAPTSVIQCTVEAMLDLNRMDAFKQLPDFERKYAAQSEYMFVRMQPMLEDMLFLGTRYEPLFDRFEILYALNYADLDESHWGPPGRFGWKYGNRYNENPFAELIEEASRHKDNWLPLRAGMFRGSYAHFFEVAERFRKGLLDKLNWW